MATTVRENVTASAKSSAATWRPNPDHAQRYYSREFMEKEWRYLWPNVWLFAGLESDVSEEGDFFKFDIGHESIIVARDDNGELVAFYNVCPHRGTPLVRQDFGATRQLICPLHSWKFALNGKNVAVTDPDTFQPEVLCNNLDLSGLRVEALGGLVFVAMNPQIEPLRDWLGPVVGDLVESIGMQNQRPVQHQQSVWEANWKTCFGVFAEIYHLHAVHPQTQSMMTDLSPIELYDRGASTLWTQHGKPAKRYPDQVSVNPALQAMLRDVGIDPAGYNGTAEQVRSDIQIAKRARAAKSGLDYSKVTDDALTDVLVLSLFPNLQISVQLEATYLIRFMPDPREPTHFIYDSLTLVPQAEAGSLRIPDWLPPAAHEAVDGRPEIERVPLGGPLDLGLLLNQDREIVPVLQRGYRSRGFRGPLWSDQELRLKHFHEELDRYIAGEME